MILIKFLEEKILSDGKVLPGNILKVGSFLNHQMDVDVMKAIGEEIARLYGNSGVTKILTIEASGIAIALAAAFYLNVPAVFAKKSDSKNLSGELYTVAVQSYTHGNIYNVSVSREFLPNTDRVLIVDDFLATGNALKGLFKMVELAGATSVGAAIAIEKGFQNGGAELRKRGYRIESLAVIESMSDDNLVFRK